MEDEKKNKEQLLSELKELRRQNSLLLHIVEKSRYMLYRMSLPEGKYEYVNPASYDVFGYSPEEFYQTPILINKIIHPDWREYFKEQWSLLLSGNIPPFFEYQVIDKKGNTRWIYQKNVLVHDPDGKPVAIEGTVTDISMQKSIEADLRESENRLLEAQRMAQIGNWYWDVKTGNVQWSEEVFNIFRLDPGEFKPQIDSILSLSPWPEDHQRGQELIRKAIASREKGSYEQKFLYPDGSTGYYFSTFQGIYDDDGDLIAIKGTVQNITERKRAEEEKNRLEEQFRQAQKVESIGRLAGGVAHDLNNLLTPILGYAEILIHNLHTTEKQKEFLGQIKHAGLRARELTGQLLAFSRKQTLEYKTLDMNKVIGGIESLLKRTIREDIKIEFILTKKVLPVRADAGQIEQVILNLAVNAQDAMPEGGIITFETGIVKHDTEYADKHFASKPGEYIMLAISDTGFGMDEKTCKHIFEPFFSTKGKLGTGLGLATVYGIVKQHEGNIFVYSEPGKGTTFKIYLPFYKDEKVKKIIHKKKPKKLRGSETILLAEDNEHVRRISQIILQRHGYTVIEAENGTEALSVLETCEGPIHLLLTDVIMPGMTGSDLFSRAVKKYPGLKVLYMSGYTDNVIAHHGILNEGIQFIQKPFLSEALAFRIREILDTQ